MRQATFENQFDGLSDKFTKAFAFADGHNREISKHFCSFPCFLTAVRMSDKNEHLFDFAFFRPIMGIMVFRFYRVSILPIEYNSELKREKRNSTVEIM